MIKEWRQNMWEAVKVVFRKKFITVFLNWGIIGKWYYIVPGVQHNDVICVQYKMITTKSPVTFIYINISKNRIRNSYTWVN